MRSLEAQNQKKPIATQTIVVRRSALRLRRRARVVVAARNALAGRSDPAGAFSKISDITSGGGRRVVLYRIEANEPILASKITGPGPARDAVGTLQEGMRAVTIRPTTSKALRASCAGRPCRHRADPSAATRAPPPTDVVLQTRACWRSIRPPTRAQRQAPRSRRPSRSRSRPPPRRSSRLPPPSERCRRCCARPAKSPRKRRVASRSKRSDPQRDSDAQPEGVGLCHHPGASAGGKNDYSVPAEKAWFHHDGGPAGRMRIERDVLGKFRGRQNGWG